MPNRWVTSVLATVLLAAACGGGTSLPGPAVVTFPISALGAEGQVLVRQLSRFMKDHPGIKVVQRVTPDAADQKHQLYVQWLNDRLYTGAGPAAAPAGPSLAYL